jgi:AcrR family transcriptional regulator
MRFLLAAAGTGWYHSYAVPGGTRQEEISMESPDSASARGRIIAAAFAVLQERGYAGTSTREIAARAKVSKRDIYAEFKNKEGVFAACIATRTALVQKPLEPAPITDRRTLEAALQRVGVGFVTLWCDPAVLSMFRLAMASADQSPDLPRLLDAQAREPSRKALQALMARARSAGLLTGAPAEMASRFVALLVGDLALTLLLGLAAPPSRSEIERRARAASDAFLALYA